MASVINVEEQIKQSRGTRDEEQIKQFRGTRDQTKQVNICIFHLPIWTIAFSNLFNT